MQQPENATPERGSDTVEAVYALREAAIEHGKAIAELDAGPTPEARDQVLNTHIALEEKTIAAIDECSDNADEAVAEAVAATAPETP